MGVKEINENVATAIRTFVVLLSAWGIILVGGQLKEIKKINKLNLLFLVLSSVSTGLSWLYYFKALETEDESKVAPIDKWSVVFAMALAFLILKEPLLLKPLLVVY